MEVVFENQETKTGVFLIRDSVHWHEESNTYTADFFWPFITKILFNVVRERIVWHMGGKVIATFRQRNWD